MTAEQEERTVEELRDELRSRDLKVSGTKDELVARLDDHEAEGGSDAPGSSGNGSPSGLREVVRTIRDGLSEVLGFEAERVTGLARTGEDAGWHAEVDVVEVARIPPSTDVLATYAVTTDREGHVAGFERVRRFRRSDGEDDR